MNFLKSIFYLKVKVLCRGQAPYNPDFFQCRGQAPYAGYAGSFKMANPDFFQCRGCRGACPPTFQFVDV